MLKKTLLVSALTLCATQIQAFDLKGALKNSGGSLVKAATINESTVMHRSRAAVKHMDSKSKVNSENGKSTKRLLKLVSKIKLPNIDGVKFNFKVYQTDPDNLNAFATPDGSIRFHSALMDAMTDEQVLAVLGHEIGHVVEKHSFKQMRKALLTQAGIRAAAGSSSTGTEVYNAGVGQFTEQFLGASFSRSDEASADKYALKVLREANENPAAMLGAIRVLQEAYGDGGGMLSSHPSNSKRIKKLERAIARDKKKQKNK